MTSEPIRMLRRHGYNVNGDVATFTPEHADWLLGHGYATKMDGTAPKLAVEPQLVDPAVEVLNDQLAEKAVRDRNWRARKKTKDK